MSAMYALFDDSGKFLAGRVMSEAENSMQIELDSGKRVKVKSAHVLLRFERPSPAELIIQAQRLAQDIDLDLAWEFAPDSEFGFADLARTVDALADGGDATAIAILEEAAGFLADLGLAARRAFGQPSLAWSHAGSVFRSRLIREELEQRLGPPAAPKLPPVGGALWRAAELTGWPVDAGFIRSVAAHFENQ